MNIPQDIVDEILSLLPVKSLIRFKVVCKDWNSNIHSHSFIAKHIKNAGKKEAIKMVLDEILTRLPVESLARFKGVCKDCEKEKEDSDDGLTLFHQYYNRQEFMKYDPLLGEWKYNQVEKIGTCNGLVCLDYYYSYLGPDRFLKLWNPATRDFKTLPKFLPDLPPLGTKRYGDDVGFGFDRANKDYKVIRISYFQKIWQLRRELKEYIVKMGIYSLSTDSWKELDCSGFSTEIIGPSTKSGIIFGEEKYCWLAKDSSGKERLILSFDMGKEVFQKTPLPSDYEHLERSDTKLFNLHDSIALVQHRFMEKTFAIWSRKELEQESNSWIKLSNVDYHSRIGRALGFWKCKNSNNFLFLFSRGYDIKGVYMDIRDTIKTGRFMTINVNNHSIGLPIKVLSYTETLVPVN